jgi:hypothetical protein
MIFTGERPSISDWAHRPRQAAGIVVVEQDLQAKHIEAHPGRARRSAPDAGQPRGGKLAKVVPSGSMALAGADFALKLGHKQGPHPDFRHAMRAQRDFGAAGQGRAGRLCGLTGKTAYRTINKCCKKATVRGFIFVWCAKFLPRFRALIWDLGSGVLRDRHGVEPVRSGGRRFGKR